MASKSIVREKSYVIMKADAKEALELVTERSVKKQAPEHINVHRLERDQIQAFVGLYNRCFIASPDPFCPLTIEEAKKLDTEGVFVADVWGTPSGFIACFVENKGDRPYGEITGIGVLPHRRRKGVATSLIRAAADYFISAGVDEVYCEVYEDNVPSKMLISSYGFREVGRRSFPVTTPEGTTPEAQLPGGKIMRRLGLRPRPGCEDCRDI
ncbi:MAG: hypothetical protein C4K49_04145 [Candidatus Thorarchaeota archaeon]|nr:MAG: hypothetical protein C4K49_04145 [Candidatus Thorarchaeota archaeon]